MSFYSKHIHIQRTCIHHFSAHTACTYYYYILVYWYRINNFICLFYMAIIKSTKWKQNSNWRKRILKTTELGTEPWTGKSINIVSGTLLCYVLNHTPYCCTMQSSPKILRLKLQWNINLWMANNELTLHKYQWFFSFMIPNHKIQRDNIQWQNIERMPQTKYIDVS